MKPTALGATAPDELMILWGRAPGASTAELFLPALDARDIARLMGAGHSAPRVNVVDENHALSFDAGGATFIPLPRGAGPAAGLLTMAPATRDTGRGEAYDVLHAAGLTEVSAAVRKGVLPPAAGAAAAAEGRRQGPAEGRGAGATDRRDSTRRRGVDPWLGAARGLAAGRRGVPARGPGRDEGGAAAEGGGASSRRSGGWP